METRWYVRYVNLGKEVEVLVKAMEGQHISERVLEAYLEDCGVKKFFVKTGWNEEDWRMYERLGVPVRWLNDEQYKRAKKAFKNKFGSELLRTFGVA